MKMKKYLLAFILLGSVASTGFSQSKILVPKEVYAEMKAKGALKEGTEYVIINENKETPASPVTQEHLNKMGYGSASSAGAAAASCSCIVPLDASFNVAEFVGYTPPNYRNDDASTGVKTLPFNFCLYGTNYTQLYINNNGNVSFGTPYATFTAAGFPDPSYIMVAPFWGDVDTRNPSSGLVYYKITSTYMIVKWENVGYYDSYVDKKNTFQLIITDGTDPILPAGNNIAFCYGDMQWTTGDASSGSGGFGGTPATVGINKGDGVNYIQMGRFDMPGIAYDGGYGASDGVSWLDNQSLYFNACNSTNIAPIPSGLNNCDTIHICGSGDTLILNGLFLSPEIGQNTTLNINLNSTPGATILSNTPGNSANGQVQIIASAANAGNNVITFTATDNGSPAGITTVNVNVYVDTTGLAGFNPHISGTLEFCEGSTSVLSVAPTTYDSYFWNTGSTNTSITVDSSGQYWVTSVKNGCYKTNSVEVVVHPKPTPLIAGYPYACGGTTSLYSDSLIYTSYLWSNGNTNDSVTVGLGTYTLTVTDTNGCTATSPPVTVTAPVAPVITGITAVCNGDLATLTTTIPYVTYNWSTSSTNDSITVPGGTYSVTVVDVNGCTISSAPFNVNTFNFTLNVTGVVPFCSNDSIPLTAAGTPSTGATYSWSSGSNIATEYATTGGNYTVTITYPNGCSGDSTLLVPPPTPAPTPVITGPLFTCGPGSTTLYIDSAALYTSYVWSNSSTNDSVTTNSGTYTVTVIGANGCDATSPAVTVINANPLVTINGLQAFCPGDSTLLTANVNLPSGANYLWSNSSTQPTIYVNSAGSYTVAVAYSNGCSTADTIMVTEYAAPHADFSTSPAVVANLGTTTSFIDGSSIASGSIVSWYWNFGDGLDSLGSISFFENPTHQYQENGVYTVTLAVQSSNGCWDTVRFEYTVISDIQVPNVFTPNGDGINDYLAFKNIEFFPNTALTVYNRWGNKVYSSPDYHNDWKGEDHKDGVYYFILQGPELKEPKYGFVQILSER